MVSTADQKKKCLKRVKHAQLSNFCNSLVPLRPSKVGFLSIQIAITNIDTLKFKVSREKVWIHIFYSPRGTILCFSENGVKSHQGEVCRTIRMGHKSTIALKTTSCLSYTSKVIQFALFFSLSHFFLQVSTSQLFFPIGILTAPMYRIVASTNTCYYSENQVFWGVTTRDMSLKETCFYS